MAELYRRLRPKGVAKTREGLAEHGRGIQWHPMPIKLYYARVYMNLLKIVGREGQLGKGEACSGSATPNVQQGRLVSVFGT